jgi:isopenicillin-N epimerase
VASPFREHWLLDPNVTFLNHGSFGACPRPVLAEQVALRELMERAPIQFLWQELPARLARARERVAEFVGADADDLVFTSNATEGVNAVLRSLDLAPDDEILVTNHGYRACANVVRFVTERTGARAVLVDVPFPIADPEQVVAAILRAQSPRTRLCLVDHVTSNTGLVFPIARIVTALRERGVEALVDGAHAPGMVDVALNDLGAAYYAANFHKWGCAPKGAAMLWVRRDLQARVIPGVISHGYGAPLEHRYRALFDWTGTRDPTPWLCIPHALDWLSSLFGGGFAEVRARNRELALEARDVLCARLAIAPPAPDSMVGSLAAVPLARRAVRRDPGGQVELYHALLARGFEALVQPWPDDEQLVVRVSAQLYNERADFERFADALAAELGL